MKKSSQKSAGSGKGTLYFGNHNPQEAIVSGSREELSFVQDVLASLSAHISVIDQTGKIIAVNKSWKRFSHENGGDPGQMTGTGVNYLEICRRAAAAGDKLAGKAVEGIQQVLDMELPAFYLEYPCHAPDEKRWFMMRVTPLPSVNRGAVIAHEDISERKLAEFALQARLREIDFLHRLTSAANQVSDLASLNEAVVMLSMELTGFDAGGIYLLSQDREIAELQYEVNLPEGVAELFSRVPAQEPPFSQVFEAGEVLEYKNHKTEGPEELRQGPIIRLVSIPIFHRQRVIGALNLASEGEKEYPRETIDLLLAASRQVGSVITKMRNEERLKDYAQRLEENNKDLQDFAYISSHDLQEPLRKIQTFASRLKIKEGDNLSEGGMEYLNRMYLAAERMQNLIKGLLGYSRITTLAQPFEMVDLNRVLEGVLSDLEIAIEESNAKIQVGDLAVIEADRTQMRQLLQNLISNGLRFHKSSSCPEIEVKASFYREGQEAKKWLRLEIKDNGIGFEEKYLDRIFGLFQRLEGRKYEGSGIGLAICKKIVTRHGGEITARSQPGEGTTFIVSLPLNQT